MERLTAEDPGVARAVSLVTVRSAGRGVGAVAERQVGLVLLHGVQSEDGEQPVQRAAEIGDL